MILGEKKKGPKKGPSKKMFQGEKCSVCEDPGRFRNYIFSLSITDSVILNIQNGPRLTLGSIQCITGVSQKFHKRLNQGCEKIFNKILFKEDCFCEDFF